MVRKSLSRMLFLGQGSEKNEIDKIRWVVSSFRRLLEKYYCGIQFKEAIQSKEKEKEREKGKEKEKKMNERECVPCDFEEREVPRWHSSSFIFPLLLLIVALLSETNFGSFGSHSSAIHRKVFSEGQSRVPWGLTPRHWPAPFSCFVLFFRRRLFVDPLAHTPRHGERETLMVPEGGTT